MTKNGILTDRSISILVALRTGVQSPEVEDRFNIQRALEKLEAERQAIAAIKKAEEGRAE